MVLLNALLLSAAAAAGGKKGMMGMGMMGDKSNTPSSWDLKKAEVLENCSYWTDEPQYAKIFEHQALASDFEKLHDEHDLRCTPKPATAHENLGHIDVADALAMLATYDSAVWEEEVHRQKKFAVHSETSSIVFLWKRFFFSEQLVLPHWMEWESIVRPVVELFCEQYGYRYEDVDIWKAMLARLPAGKDITQHRDINPLLAFAHRIHWCVSSEEGTTTRIGSEYFTEKDLPQGTVFQFNNVMNHDVSNKGSVDRIHLVLDIVPKKLAGIGMKTVKALAGEL